MNVVPRVECVRATPAERAELLTLMRTELASRLEQTLAFMGLTWPDFAKLYESRGEVRTMRVGGVVVGHCWIEQRDRELHLHAIIVLPEHRGRGIGGATLRGLEAEFAERVDVMELGVERGNAGARSLYLREGFEVVDALEAIGFEVMRKRIGGQPAD